MNNNKLLLILILFSFSCTKKKEMTSKEQNKADLEEVEKYIEEESIKKDDEADNYEDRSMNEITDKSDTLTRNIIERGDTESYDALMIYALDYPPDEFLFYTMHMANKYGYPQACMDLYHSISWKYEREGIDFKDIDSNTKRILKEYLQVAANQGHKQAKETLEDFDKSEDDIED